MSRLTASDIIEYVSTTYNINKPVMMTSSIIAGVDALLQKDYGLLQDCTLTSLTSAILYHTRDIAPFSDEFVYEEIEKIAKQCLYNGDTYGTMMIAIRKIYSKSITRFRGVSEKTHQKYIKGIGYEFSDIKAQIVQKNPVLLTMTNDGRNYYKNHTVLVIGYQIYLVNYKEVPILLVYDNWHKTFSCLDYNKLSLISCINYR